MDIVRKSVMVIEPNSSGGLSLLRSAQRIGVEVHAVTHQDLYEEQYTQEMKGLIHHVLFTDFRDEKRSIGQMADYGSRHGISGVVSGFEFMSELAVKVSSSLSLPTHDVDKCESLRRKDLMHWHFRNEGVPCAKTKVVQSWDECRAAAMSMKFPVVIKPSSNAGSVGVFGVRNMEELQNAYDWIHASNTEFPHGMRLDDHVLVQEYLDGPEVSVEAAIVDGAIHILGITDKLTTTGKYFAETGHTLPTTLDTRSQQALTDATKSAITALGLKNGIAHVEAKLTSKGPRIIEVGARMPGDRIPELLYSAFAVDEGAIYLQTAMGLVPEIMPRTARYAAIRFITSPRQGTIERISGADRLAQRKDVAEVSFYLPVGAQIGTPMNNIERIGHVISVSDSYDHVCRIIADALDEITITIV